MSDATVAEWPKIKTEEIRQDINSAGNDIVDENTPFYQRIIVLSNEKNITNLRLLMSEWTQKALNIIPGGSANAGAFKRGKISKENQKKKPEWLKEFNVALSTDANGTKRKILETLQDSWFLQINDKDRQLYPSDSNARSLRLLELHSAVVEFMFDQINLFGFVDAETKQAAGMFLNLYEQTRNENHEKTHFLVDPAKTLKENETARDELMLYLHNNNWNKPLPSLKRILRVYFFLVYERVHVMHAAKGEYFQDYAYKQPNGEEGKFQFTKEAWMEFYRKYAEAVDSAQGLPVSSSSVNEVHSNGSNTNNPPTVLNSIDTTTTTLPTSAPNNVAPPTDSSSSSSSTLPSSSPNSSADEVVGAVHTMLEGSPMAFIDTVELLQNFTSNPPDATQFPETSFSKRYTSIGEIKIREITSAPALRMACGRWTREVLKPNPKTGGYLNGYGEKAYVYTEVNWRQRFENPIEEDLKERDKLKHEVLCTLQDAFLLHKQNKTNTRLYGDGKRKKALFELHLALVWYVFEKVDIFTFTDLETKQAASLFLFMYQYTRERQYELKNEVHFLFTPNKQIEVPKQPAMKELLDYLQGKYDKRSTENTLLTEASRLLRIVYFILHQKVESLLVQSEVLIYNDKGVLLSDDEWLDWYVHLSVKVSSLQKQSAAAATIDKAVEKKTNGYIMLSKEEKALVRTEEVVFRRLIRTGSNSKAVCGAMLKEMRKNPHILDLRLRFIKEMTTVQKYDEYIAFANEDGRSLFLMHCWALGFFFEDITEKTKITSGTVTSFLEAYYIVRGEDIKLHPAEEDQFMRPLLPFFKKGSTWMDTVRPMSNSSGSTSSPERDLAMREVQSVCRIMIKMLDENTFDNKMFEPLPIQVPNPTSDTKQHTASNRLLNLLYMMKTINDPIQLASFGIKSAVDITHYITKINACNSNVTKATNMFKSTIGVFTGLFGKNKADSKDEVDDSEGSHTDEEEEEEEDDDADNEGAEGNNNNKHEIDDNDISNLTAHGNLDNSPSQEESISQDDLNTNDNNNKKNSKVSKEDVKLSFYVVSNTWISVCMHAIGK